MENKEIWKDIQGYEGHYQISNIGRVKSLARKKNHIKGFAITKEIILKQQKNFDGYYNLSLKLNCCRKNYSIHRLVAIHFISNLDNKKEVNHINGIKQDNRVENLEWCTRRENIIHSFNTGLNAGNKGEKHGMSKITELQVLEIKQRLKNGQTHQKIAEIYNVGRTTISAINQNKNWNYL